jgi:hypothetical protein
MDTSVPKPPESSKSNAWMIVAGIILACSCLLLASWLGCAGSLAWFVNQENTHATATAETKLAVGTATSATRATEIAREGLLDPFDSNMNGWMVGKIDAFWNGEVNIKDGAYHWNVEKIKKGFLHYSVPSNLPVVTDFDLLIETKILEGSPGACSGLLFRTHPSGWEYGGYAISVCKEGIFFVGYVDGQGKWVKSSNWITSPAIKSDDWNRIEVNTRGSRFILKINDFVVYEMNDTNRIDGKVAVFVEIHEDSTIQGTHSKPGKADLSRAALPAKFVPVIFLFDNFELQNK